MTAETCEQVNAWVTKKMIYSAHEPASFVNAQAVNS